MRKNDRAPGTVYGHFDNVCVVTKKSQSLLKFTYEIISEIRCSYKLTNMIQSCQMDRVVLIGEDFSATGINLRHKNLASFNQMFYKKAIVVKHRLDWLGKSMQFAFKLEIRDQFLGLGAEMLSTKVILKADYLLFRFAGLKK